MSDNKKLGPISRIIEHEAYLSVNAISQWLSPPRSVAFYSSFWLFWIRN